MFTQDVPDQDSIGSYYKSENYISHTDTDQGIVNQLYHKVRKRTLVQKQKLVNKVTSLHKGRILDIGAGTGAFANQMQQSGWTVTALEPDAATVRRAKELYGLNLRPSAELHNLPPDSFDAVTMWHVLEHVHDLHGTIEKINQLLVSTGVLIVAVPNYTSFDAAAYQQYWAAYDVPRHLYHFSPLSIRLLMEKHGFLVDKILPMWFDSFYVSLLSEQYRNGKQNLFSGFMHGLKSNIKSISNRQRASSLIYIIRKK
jgi:2-polyprenyl-3-methyl-5-hydroxy-6-metoxy-1,4-benzoquinol methylase